MTDVKTPVYKLGQVRYKYLDLANMAFAQGHFPECVEYINAFLETVKDETDAGMKIKEEFDRIEMDRRLNVKKLAEEIKDLGYLEQRDANNLGRERIELEAIHDRKTVCWTVSLTNGLFES
jgi:hypothetical protein